MDYPEFKYPVVVTAEEVVDFVTKTSKKIAPFPRVFLLGDDENFITATVDDDGQIVSLANFDTFLNSIQADEILKRIYDALYCQETVDSIKFAVEKFSPKFPVFDIIFDSQTDAVAARRLIDETFTRWIHANKDDFEIATVYDWNTPDGRCVHFTTTPKRKKKLTPAK